MGTPPPRRYAAPLVMFLGLLPSAAIAQSGQNTSSGLVPAQYGRQIQDTQGFAWDMSPQGAIQSGTNHVFRSAGVLLVGGSTFSPSQSMMTPDGTQYVMTGGRSGCQITRRIKIDKKTAAVRYVDSFQNPTGTPMNLDVRIMLSFRSSVRSVVTDQGRPVAAGGGPFSGAPGSAGTPGLGEQECGMLVTLSSSSYPAVLVYLGGPRSELRPVLERQGSTQFQFRYAVTVPANKIVSIVHGLAQRRVSGTPNPKSPPELFKPFQSRDFLRDVPSEVRRTILNGGRSIYAEDIVRAPLLQAVMELADRWEVERGKADVLVQGEGARLVGTVRGSGLTVQTRFGPSEVPLEQVALLIGGGGVGRAMRVHLRNGEVLVGPVDAGELTLESETGLEVALAAKQVNALFLHADSADGKAPAGAVAMLKTHHGDQLALAADSPSKIGAATAWGPIAVPVEEVDYLYPVREPQPVHRLLLHDKSRLSVILDGGELDLATLRFGRVKVAPGAIARLAGVEAVSEAKPDADPDEEQAKPSGPHCRLVAGNLLVARVDGAALSLSATGGATSVDVDELHRMDRQDEDDPSSNPAFTFGLTSGKEVVGRLRGGVLPLRALGRAWEIPAYHVLAFRCPERAPEEKDDSADDSEAGAKSEAPKPGASPPGEGTKKPPPKPKPPASTPARPSGDPFAPSPADDPFAPPSRR